MELKTKISYYLLQAKRPRSLFLKVIFVSARKFGMLNKVGIHQKVSAKNFKCEVDSALYNAARANFETIYLYIW